MILVSVIIVNYNTKHLLKDCISSIYKITQNVSFEIIVVDNNSADGSESMVVDNFSEVIFIQSGSNLGFGNANNLGLSLAKGQLIFFLNSDTILLNNAIKVLADFLTANPSVAVCGGNLFDIELNPAISFSQSLPGIGSDLDVLFGNFFSKLYYKNNISFNYSNSPLLIDGFISGADMMIRKSILEKVGCFDPDFFMYYEETELTWRIKKAGFKIASVPDAKIIHLEGASEAIKEKSINRSNKSKYLYYKKTNKSNVIALSHIIFTITAWSRITYFYLRANTTKYKYWQNILKWTTADYYQYKKI